MSDREYPKQYSQVEVTFTDGQVSVYTITAGVTISQYLARQAAETNILTLLNDDVSVNIPISQIREYVLSPLPRN